MNGIIGSRVHATAHIWSGVTLMTAGDLQESLGIEFGGRGAAALSPINSHQRQGLRGRRH